jgi:zinc transporter ZupT
MPADLFTSLAASALLALVHLGVSGLHRLGQRSRRFWLSMGGGTAVAYVFLHLLPELQHHQGDVEDAADAVLGWLDRHVYLLALVGLTVFYGLERLALRERRGRPQAAGSSTNTDTDTDTGSGAQTGDGSDQQTGAATFWLSMSGFTMYNALIGYLLVEEAARGWGQLLLLTLAMALHFLVNDYALREHHQARYRRTGRWVLSAAVLLGTGLGLVGTVPPLVVSLLVAVLAGGVVLNVLKEELPAARESSFGAFLLGVVGYTALLLML